jgi:Ca-activated chloride channel family protein
LNESLLQEIGKATGGFYQRLAGANTIDTLYERGLAPLPKTEFAAQRVRRWHERYQWFLGLAIALLLAEMFIPERRSQKSMKPPADDKDSSPLATVSRTAALIILALMMVTTAGASPDAALKRYTKGRFDSALSEYERLLAKKPADPALSFNAGTAAFRAGDYGKAAEHLQSALLAPDLKLQQGAWYNMGNTQFRLGEDAKELEDKERLWTQSTNSFDSALKLHPQDADARANLEFVQRKLEELKQQQQQQQKDKSDKQDDKDQKDKDDQQQQQNQKQDQKDQQQKQDQKQNQEKSEEQKKQEQEQQKQRDQQQQEQKKADEQKAKEQQQAGKKPDQKPESAGYPENKNAQPNQQMEVRMTPQQAKQLLDTQKEDERMMIFLPETRTNRANRVFKDW